jgi:hypothetical protein
VAHLLGSRGFDKPVKHALMQNSNLKVETGKLLSVPRYPGINRNKSLFRCQYSTKSRLVAGAIVAAEVLTSNSQMEELMKRLPKDWSKKNLEVIVATQVVDEKAGDSFHSYGTLLVILQSKFSLKRANSSRLVVLLNFL